LPQTELDVLGWMAVYDRPIDFSTLQTISNHPQMTLLNTVEQLTQRQILIEATGQYHFDHNKIREVVYNDLSATRRRLYHQQIADILGGRSPAADKASILAYHFERSGNTDKAIGFWLQAGEHALSTYAYQQATQHFERALALADAPGNQMDAYLGLAEASMLLDEHKGASAVIQQGLLLSEHANDAVRQLRLLFAQAKNASRQHRADGGQAEVEAALSAAEQAGDEYYIAQCLLLLTEVHESNGDLNSALQTANQAQIVSNKLNDNQLEARALVEIGFLNAQKGDFIKAASAAEMGLRLLEKTGDRNAMAYAWNILGRALGGSGDYSRALDVFQHSGQEAQVIGDRYLLAQVFNMKGWIYRELGDYESALKFDTEGMDFAKQWNKPSPEISARLNLCLDILHLGDPEKAMFLLNEIETQISAGSFGFHRWRWELRVLHTRGLCALAQDEPERALDLAKSGAMLAKAKGSQKYVALNHEMRGTALAASGDSGKAIEHLKIAVSLADKIQYQPIRWAGRHRLGNLYLDNGLAQESKVALGEANEVIQTIASALDDEKLRAIFLSTALA
jgi:tetratricopeptide (TPR) repeat protein